MLVIYFKINATKIIIEQSESASYFFCLVPNSYGFSYTFPKSSQFIESVLHTNAKTIKQVSLCSQSNVPP